MKLVYIPGACSLAINIALSHAEQAVELIAYDPATKATADGQQLSAVTAKPYVPTLLLDDGEVLNETSAILMSLDEMFPNAGLLPQGARARREAREWLVFISTELHKTFAPLFAPTTPAEQIEACRTRIADRLDFVASALEGREFLVDDTFSAPDMYLFVMTLWANVQSISLDHWPSLAAFQERAQALPAVIAAMQSEGLLEVDAKVA